MGGYTWAGLFNSPGICVYHKKKHYQYLTVGKGNICNLPEEKKKKKSSILIDYRFKLNVSDLT